MTTIGPNTRVDGRIEGDEDVTIFGNVSGSITLNANLIVADGGQVHGDVNARQIIVEGYVEGSLTASELLVLADTARVVANIDTVALRMDDGAQLSGDVLMDVKGEVPTRKMPAVGGPTTQKMPAVQGKQLVEETVIDDDDEYWTFDDLTVKELRDLLRDYDAPVTGTKAELIARLEELEE